MNKRERSFVSQGRYAKGEHGFTLVELLISLVMAGFIVSAVFIAHESQQKVYNVQDQVAEMQQNLRATMDFLVSEFRLAGYDPVVDIANDQPKAGAGFTQVTLNSPYTSTTPAVGAVTFTADIMGNGQGYVDATNTGDGVDNDVDGVTDEPSEEDGDGTLNLANESFTIALQGDADGNGIPDAAVDGVYTVGSIVRGVGNNPTLFPVADNIQAVEFRYLDASGNDASATPATITSVEISLLARAKNPDYSYVDTNTYTPLSGVDWDLNTDPATTVAGDHYRRRMLTASIRLRN